MHEEMEASIEELLMEAIMSEIPLIIVEGADDIPFYNKLAFDIKKNVNIMAIENIKDYSEGCENVKNAIEDIQDIIHQKENNYKYILGIVDRDARFYRNEIPNLTSLFILKYYSFESHLANKYGLCEIIPEINGLSMNMIDEGVLRFIEKDLESDYQNLFYISLEALKFACNKNYNADVRYKEKAGKIFAKDYLEKIKIILETKKNELDEFAQEHNITLGNLRNIAKGKWYLHVYADSTYKNIRQLENACKQSRIKQCQYCKVGKYDKCMYKLKNNFQLGQIINLLITKYDENEVKYIKERIRELA